MIQESKESFTRNI